MRRQSRLPQPSRQGGVVALVFALTLVAMLAAAGLVIDLGHLYVLKSELQNAADSAALGAAKEIDLSSTGITKAVTKAKAYAAQNKYDFQTALVLADSDILFSSTPNGPWVSSSDASASPSSKSFVKVDTGTKTISTYLLGVLGTTSTATTASSVAGRFVVDITPLAICARDPVNASGALTVTSAATGLPTGDKELIEYGFRRGYTYDVLNDPPIAGPADAMLVNPVDTFPTACSPSNSSAAFTAPFLCQGNSAIGSSTSAVYTNTGGSVGPTEKAINSRMDSYPGGTQCLTSTAPPDTNVQEYDSATGVYSGPWTYTRAVRAVVDGSGYKAGTAFDTSNWNDLYPGGIQGNTAANKTKYPAGSTDTPYTTYTKTPTHTGVAGRRIMNMALVDCTGVGSGSMSCKKLPIVGIGRFFMRNTAALNGGSKNFSLEYVSLIEPVPNSEIKLYK
jgi:Flp pilus assembly protein TadG